MLPRRKFGVRPANSSDKSFYGTDPDTTVLHLLLSLNLHPYA